MFFMLYKIKGQGIRNVCLNTDHTECFTKGFNCSLGYKRQRKCNNRKCDKNFQGWSNVDK